MTWHGQMRCSRFRKFTVLIIFYSLAIQLTYHLFIRIRDIVNDAINGDLTKFRPKQIYSYERGEYNQPKDNPGAEVGDSLDSQPINVRNLRKALTKAILLEGADEALATVRHEAQLALPSLTFIESTDDDEVQTQQLECAQPGMLCGSSNTQRCCDGMTCLFNPAIDASFCVGMVRQ